MPLGDSANDGLAAAKITLYTALEGRPIDRLRRFWQTTVKPRPESGFALLLRGLPAFGREQVAGATDRRGDGPEEVA